MHCSSASVYCCQHKLKNEKQGRPGNTAARCLLSWERSCQVFVVMGMKLRVFVVMGTKLPGVCCHGIVTLLIHLSGPSLSLVGMSRLTLCVFWIAFELCSCCTWISNKHCIQYKITVHIPLHIVSRDFIPPPGLLLWFSSVH